MGHCVTSLYYRILGTCRVVGGFFTGYQGKFGQIVSTLWYILSLIVANNNSKVHIAAGEHKRADSPSLSTDILRAVLLW